MFKHYVHFYASFDYIMSDISYGENCDCVADCEAASFTKFETNEALPVNELCDDKCSWVMSL